MSRPKVLILGGIRRKIASFLKKSNPTSTDPLLLEDDDEIILENNFSFQVLLLQEA